MFIRFRPKPVNEFMEIKNFLKTSAIAALLILSSLSASAQDLLARQAPVDRRARRVDTLVLQNLLSKENLDNPASELYSEWANERVHHRGELPDSFRINLRHFHMPTPSRVITSNFGSRWGSKHEGLDIKVYIGDTIRAAFSGKVRIVKYEGRGYGKYVVIRHNNGLETVYGHLSKQLVKENQIVKAGEPIGLGGNTGRSTGSHLHFETLLCGTPINPALMFDFRAQDVVADSYTFHKSSYDNESREATRSRGVKGGGGYTSEEVRGELAQETQQTDGGEKLYHKVAKGETLYSIANKRGVTVDTLLKLNNLSKKSKIRAGMMLRYS